ncbi:MAG: hypothetical protein GYB68_12630, partial [Chloroflexi bacterium]|nr:hypothetical protein [Chloroflexota bacterium]
IVWVSFPPRPAQDTAAPDPARMLQSAWQQAEHAGRFGFRSEVEYRHHPAPKVTNAGRESNISFVYLEGDVDRAAETLNLRIWGDNSTITSQRGMMEIHIADGTAMGRVGDGAWEEIEHVDTSFAPDNNPLAYLAAADDVHLIDTETRRVPAVNDGATARELTVTRLGFRIDGPTFADAMRTELQEQYQQQHDLPLGLTLDAPDHYHHMVGTGELWLDTDGLPLRLTMQLTFPPLTDGSQMDAHIQHDFHGFASPDTAALPPFWAQPLGWTAGVLGMLTAGVDWRNLGLTLGLLLGMTGFVALITFRHRSKAVYASVAGFMIVALVFPQLLQAHEVHAFVQQQNATYAAQQEEHNATAELEAEVAASTWDPTIPPLEQADRRVTELQAGRLAADVATQVDVGRDQAAADLAQVRDDDSDTITFHPNRDDDGDGLTNLEEARLGTNDQSKDSDGDHIPDNVEVHQAVYVEDGPPISDGTHYYLDPNSIDTNRDGRADGMECPNWARNPADINNQDYTDLPQGGCNDTDNDGTPDVFDLDDDGDGVGDLTDDSPGAKGNTTYSDSTPLRLKLNNVNNQPVEVHIQARPTNPDHLTYGLGVLDWPNDGQGQVQKLLPTTLKDSFPFTATNGSQDKYQGSQRPEADLGDMQLVPFFEITIPRSNTGSGYLPLKEGVSDVPPFPSDTSAKSLSQWVDSWIDKKVMERYGISVSPLTNGNLVLHQPASLIRDYQTQLPVLFEAHLYYHPQHDQTNWNAAHEIKLVWGVQILTDQCDTKSAPDRVKPENNDGKTDKLEAWCKDSQNRFRVPPQSMQLYPEEWTLVGAQVNEEYGTDIAMIVQPPDADGPNNPHDLPTNGQTMMANDLEVVWAEGRDCPSTTNNGTQCAGSNGKRDLALVDRNDSLRGDVSLITLWGNTNTSPDVTAPATGPATGICQTANDGAGPNGENIANADPRCWGIPSDSVKTWVNSYATDVDASTDLMQGLDTKVGDPANGQIKQLLSNTFAQDHTPTVLFAREERRRIDALTNSNDGNENSSPLGSDGSLTFDLDPSTIKVQVQTTLHWSPYAYKNGQWTQTQASERVITVEDSYLAMFKQETNGVFDDGSGNGAQPISADSLEGAAIVASHNYLRLSYGTQNIVQYGETLSGIGAVRSDIADGVLTDLPDWRLYQKFGTTTILKLTSKTLEGYIENWIKANKDFKILSLSKSYNRLSEDETIKIRTSGFTINWRQMASQIKAAFKKTFKDYVFDTWLKGKVNDPVLAKEDEPPETPVEGGRFISYTALSVLIGLTAVGAIAATVLGIKDGYRRALEVLFDTSMVFLKGRSLVSAITGLATRVKTSAGEAVFGEFRKTVEKGAKYTSKIAAAAITAIIAVGITIGLGIWQIEHTPANSIARDQEVGLIVAQVIVTVIMIFIKMIPVVGYLIETLISVIDVLIDLFCAIFDSSSIICKGLEGLLASEIAKVIVSDEMIGDLKDPNRIQIENYDQQVGNQGLIVGSRLLISFNILNTTAVRQFDTVNDVWYKNDNVDNLRNLDYRYLLTTEQDTDQTNLLDYGRLKDVWETNYFGGTDNNGYVRHTFPLLSFPYFFHEAGVNQKLDDLYLIEAFDMPTEVCDGFLIISGCKVTGREGNNPIDIGKNQYFDVFPATLTEFRALQKEGNRYRLAWDDDFPLLQDADGDGLHYSTDDNDSTYDSDFDGVPDQVEKQNGTSPIEEDTDGDGLKDGIELRIGSDPTLLDTDNDSLSDKDEVEGWEYVYNVNPRKVIWVTSDPTQVDTDGDSIPDEVEKIFGWHPRRVQNDTVMSYQAGLNEEPSALLQLPLEAGVQGSGFEDKARPFQNGTCIGSESCPQATVGYFGNGVQFDGVNDVIHVTQPLTNELGAITDEITLMAWIKPARFSGLQDIIAHGVTQNPTGEVFL